MSTKYHQISLKDMFSDCQDLFVDDSPAFFQLLDAFVDLDQFIPQSFFNAFYQKLGRKRLYPLSGFLSALILQKVLSIPSDSLLILFLSLCKELRDFCGFSKVPDAPLFTRFKQEFLPHIELMFQLMVNYTEPCRKKNPEPSNHKSGCLSGRYRQSADSHRGLPDELFTIYKKPETVSCLKTYSIVIILYSAY